MLTRDRAKRAEVVLDERDRHDYFTPSRPLFEKYCTHIIDRYSIQDIVQKGRLESLSYGFVDNLNDEKLFTLDTSNGIKYAKVVVLAVGAPHLPVLPEDSPLKHAMPQGSACHSSHISTCGLIPEHVKAKIRAGRGTNIVVIGGGLTSAQIADECIKKGVRKVFLMMRSELKGKSQHEVFMWQGPLLMISS
jgi:cation diffusion facilitator CzcD-associated flavoprotein CzcO